MSAVLAALGLAGALAFAASCVSEGYDRASADDARGDASEGRLGARPQGGRRHAGSPRPGLQRVSSGGGGLLYIPSTYSPDRRWPLVVLLHGAGSDARSGLAPLAHLADGAGAILLAPSSRDRTWDAVLGGYGPDVASIDALLEDVFGRLSVDPKRLAIGGFSDGASYALSLGLANGDLFTHLIAFSPGFISPGRRRARPAVYVSHGVRDGVLPIDRCSRRIVPSLRRGGYRVDYREFAGGHTVPREVARAALEWLTGPIPDGARRTASR